VHGTVDGSEASLKAQEDARRLLYPDRMRECDVPKSSIASECRLETLNVNIKPQLRLAAERRASTPTVVLAFGRC